eukprot:CAMPEP_0178406174 /NCGR_PEP_ID=MMETSP0689_2-20121128/18776_1 /TAXON_ID=160604 /ORGANISM="Amphidinium massartii, Strain CS-259" /LENGTH=261 /DNA_ID=CAMNT_0020027207 /DNA_START=148 /DNA_END=933 /DNA_ORIENTATION=+
MGATICTSGAAPCCVYEDTAQRCPTTVTEERAPASRKLTARTARAGEVDVGGLAGQRTFVRTNNASAVPGLTHEADVSEAALLASTRAPQAQVVTAEDEETIHISNFDEWAQQPQFLLVKPPTSPLLPAKDKDIMESQMTGSTQAPEDGGAALGEIAAPKKRASRKGTQIEVVLNRRTSQFTNLGMETDWDSTCKVFVVEVTGGGLVGEWNEEYHADDCIEAGATIDSVNGKSDVCDILEELAKAPVLQLLITPPSAEQQS